MIVCVGTTPAWQRALLFDTFVEGQVNRASAVFETAAGKAVNVAKVVHALGEPARLFSFVGGTTGRFIRQVLDQANVPNDVVEVATPTRTCTTIISQATGTVTEFVEESAKVTAEECSALSEKIRAAIPQAKVLVLSGSLAPGVPTDFYAQWIEQANALAIPVILDASGEPLRLALAKRPYVVKPNRQELAVTTGVEIDSDQATFAAIKQLLSSGPAWATITAGSMGVVISNGKQFWRVQPPKIDAVNPIGSGDAFSAGLAVALCRGEKLPDAVALAVACGASNALHMLPGQIELEQVELLRSQSKPIEIGA